MSNRMMENLNSHERRAISLPEPGTLVPGVRGALAVRLPRLTSEAREVRPRRGFTLVELLVVVFILLLVSAASIPVIAPALQGRHLREASRQVNSYFAVARDTALRNGRPVGVSIERFVSKDSAGVTTGMINEMSVLLQQVEVPEPYSGDFADSRMFFEYVFDNNVPPNLQEIRVIALRLDGSTTTPDIGWMGLVRVGDCVQLNHAGRLFEIIGDSKSPPTTPAFPVDSTPSESDMPAKNYWVLSPVDKSIPFTMPPSAYQPDATGQPTIWRSQVGAAYTIQRQPIKTATPPLQLTGTVVLDLNWSRDTENGPFSPRNPATLAKRTAAYAQGGARIEDTRPVVIMFAPDGSLQRIYRSVWIDPDDTGPLDPVWNWAGVSAPRPTGPIHLLLGQRDGIPANPNVLDTDTPPAAPTVDSQSLNNWRNLDNLWISIHPQTGLLTTTEMAEADLANQADPYGLGGRQARYFATRAKSMGGR